VCPGAEKPPVYRHIRVEIGAPPNACHAEGRGFESHQPLQKAAICTSFWLRQPASASASPCTQCGPVRLDVPVGAEKDRICRSFADARTTDLLHGWAERSRVRVARPACRKIRRSSVLLPSKSSTAGAALLLSSIPTLIKRLSLLPPLRRKRKSDSAGYPRLVRVNVAGPTATDPKSVRSDCVHGAIGALDAACDLDA
jgi:hypothetical protein